MELEEWNTTKIKLRVRVLFQTLLILFGVFFVQFAASLLCMLGWYVCRMIRGGSKYSSLQDMIAANPTDFSMAISLVYACIVIVWCGVLYRRWQWRQHPDYKKALGGKRIVGIVALGFGSCVVMTMILSIVSALFPGLFENYNRLMEELAVDSSLLTIPYVVLLGPVAEELVFRGTILDRLKTSFSFWTANVIQAALFGVFHLNVIQGLYAFCLGLVLGLVVKVTGTIIGSMMTHILFNGTTELMGLVPQSVVEQYAFVEVLLVIVAVLAFLGGFYYYWKQSEIQDFQGGI
jgi:membrane protease YdiL (CAAX protease family)